MFPLHKYTLPCNSHGSLSVTFDCVRNITANQLTVPDASPTQTPSSVRPSLQQQRLGKPQGVLSLEQSGLHQPSEPETSSCLNTPFCMWGVSVCGSSCCCVCTCLSWTPASYTHSATCSTQQVAHSDMAVMSCHLFSSPCVSLL